MKHNLTFTFCWLKFTKFHFGSQLSTYSKDITVETQSGLENWPKASPDLTIPHDVMGAPPDGALMTSWGRHMTAPSWRHEGASHDDSDHMHVSEILMNLWNYTIQQNFSHFIFETSV